MAASPSYGTTISIGGGAVAGVKSIDGPQISREIIDITSMSDSHKVKAPARPNSGTVTVELLLEDHSALLATLDATVTDTTVPSPTSVTIAFAGDGGSYAFDAFVTGFTPKASGDEALTATVTLEITGAVTVS